METLGQRQTVPRAVLIVEDDVLVGKTLVRDFARRGFEVQLSATFDEAVAVLDGAIPQLVVLDLYLGRHSGLRLIPLVRKRHPESDVAVISAYASVSTIVDAMRGGATAFLTKPVTANSVLEEIARCRNPLSYETRPTAGPQIESLVEALERKNAELQELQRFKDEMTGFVVHDLKNPLAVVMSCLDFLEPVGPVQPEVFESIRDAQSATLRILGLVTNILSIVRLEGSAIQLKPSAADLRDLLRETIRLRASRAKQRNFLVEEKIEPGTTVQCDADLLLRMVENVMDNAVRHTQSGGRIEITARTISGGVQIRIGNSGPPIPTAARSIIFEKFKKGTTKERANFGLGLYFCRLAAEAHGGRIWVEETALLPTVFVIELPAVPLASKENSGTAKV